MAGDRDLNVNRNRGNADLRCRFPVAIMHNCRYVRRPSHPRNRSQKRAGLAAWSPRLASFCPTIGFFLNNGIEPTGQGRGDAKRSDPQRPVCQRRGVSGQRLPYSPSDRLVIVNACLRLTAVSGGSSIPASVTMGGNKLCFEAISFRCQLFRGEQPCLPNPRIASTLSEFAIPGCELP